MWDMAVDDDQLPMLCCHIIHSPSPFCSHFLALYDAEAPAHQQRHSLCSLPLVLPPFPVVHLCADHIVLPLQPYLLLRCNIPVVPV